MMTYDETEEQAIPLREVQTAYDTLPRGSATRVMFGMLALTGCRITELDKMRKSMIYDDVIHFFLGKRQRKVRKIKLPSWYWEELDAMHKEEPCPGDGLFPISSESFCRYFTHVRKILNDKWRDRVIKYSNQEKITQYRYQLKGLRKNYQTIVFAHEWKRWEDADVALEFTSKAMKHSSKHITAYHYLQHFDALGLRRGVPPKALEFEGQRSLGEWI